MERSSTTCPSRSTELRAVLVPLTSSSPRARRGPLAGQLDRRLVGEALVADCETVRFGSAGMPEVRSESGDGDTDGTAWSPPAVPGACGFALAVRTLAATMDGATTGPVRVARMSPRRSPMPRDAPWTVEVADPGRFRPIDRQARVARTTVLTMGRTSHSKMARLTITESTAAGGRGGQSRR
jgi:hypothetical protein